MKTGMNLLLWTDHVTDEHFPLLAKLKAAGFDGVEIPMFHGDLAHYERIGKELRNLGLGATAVTVCNKDTNPISPESRIRLAGLAHIKNAIEWTEALGGDNLCGPYHSAIGEFTGQGPTADEKEHGADVLRQAAEHAAKHKVTMAIEYLNRFECYFLTTAADAVALVKKVGHPNFRTMYDTFHANIEEKDLAAAIAHLAPYMAHVHVS
ncbi:MAG: sugar phosphate isomerase/epimerase, partial [Gemmataceae bacterium]|nr:sugar phosphate isomerase/epimerase [Gemmataceae bacterium]